MPFWVRSALPLATEGTQECIWNLSYNERRMAIELELAKYLEEEEVDKLINQFPIPERNKVRVLHLKRELPFLRIPRVLLKGICRGKTESLSASKVTCILASLW